MEQAIPRGEAGRGAEADPRRAGKDTQRTTRVGPVRPCLEEAAGAAAGSLVLGIAHRQDERIRSEKFIFGIETRLPRLSPVRGEQTPPFRPGLDALRIVWWTLERGDARNPPAADRLARRFGKSPV